MTVEFGSRSVAFGHQQMGLDRCSAGSSPLQPVLLSIAMPRQRPAIREQDTLPITQAGHGQRRMAPAKASAQSRPNMIQPVVMAEEFRLPMLLLTILPD